MNRRTFLSSLLATAAAPCLARVAVAAPALGDVLFFTCESADEAWCPPGWYEAGWERRGDVFVKYFWRVVTDQLVSPGATS